MSTSLSIKLMCCQWCSVTDMGVGSSRRAVSITGSRCTYGARARTIATLCLGRSIEQRGSLDEVGATVIDTMLRRRGSSAMSGKKLGSQTANTQFVNRYGVRAQEDWGAGSYGLLVPSGTLIDVAALLSLPARVKVDYAHHVARPGQACSLLIGHSIKESQGVSSISLVSTCFDLSEAATRVLCVDVVVAHLRRRSLPQPGAPSKRYGLRCSVSVQLHGVGGLVNVALRHDGRPRLLGRDDPTPWIAWRGGLRRRTCRFGAVVGAPKASDLVDVRSRRWGMGHPATLCAPVLERLAEQGLSLGSLSLAHTPLARGDLCAAF